MCVAVSTWVTSLLSPSPPSDQRDRQQGREEAVYGAVEKTAAIGHYRSQVPPIPIIKTSYRRGLIGQKD